MSIGFEILHYQTIDDTIACVASISEHIKAPVIVIVDNASPNQSGKKLAELYKNQNNITVISSEENLGFAKGSNLGYKYLKEHFCCDFICCINNDTQLIEDGFETKLTKIYNAEHFGVLAPMVRLKDGSVQSFNPIFHDLDYYHRELKLYKDNESFSGYLRANGTLLRLMFRFPRIMGAVRKYRQRIKKPYCSNMKNVVLHGCFLVFSKDYTDIFDDAFDPRTFMYREEELLYLRTRAYDLTTLYSTDICIRHMENSSTNAVYSDKEAKYQFMRENQITSLGILIGELQK